MKNAIVTGASTGIGLEIAKVLLKNNFKVFGIARDFSKTEYSDDSFTKKELDILDTEKLLDYINKIKHENEIHMLVNNAGVGFFGPHEELNPKKISQICRINLEIPMILTNLLLRELKKNSGTIINISSVTAKIVSKHGCAAYAASKAGLSHFSNTLFEEVRKYGVKVHTIHPDITKTEFYRNANFEPNDDENSFLLAEEIAGIVKFIINAPSSVVISEIDIKPQKNMIKRKK